MKQYILSILLLFTVALNAQKTISGRVTNINNTGIPYANILAIGTQTGSTTDENGNYEIIIPERVSELEFSVLGYKTQTVSVLNQTIINVQLEEASEQLNEVVLTALGLKRETKELGYVVQSLDAKGVTEVKAVNFLDNLAK